MKTELPEYATDPEKALEFIEKMGYFPKKYEKVFLKDAESAYRYACLLGERLPEYLEKTFLTNAEYAVEYAENILEGRLPKEIEKVFLKARKGHHRVSAVAALEYAERVIKGRLPEYLEKVFAEDALYANLYAKNILKDQFDEEIHNRIIMIGVSNPTEQANVAKYLETCQEFNNTFIDYIKSNDLYDIIVEHHIKDHWFEEFYMNQTDWLSEYDLIIYNKLKKQKRSMKFKEVLHE